MASVRLVTASPLPMTDTKVGKRERDGDGDRNGGRKGGHVLKIQDFSYARDNSSQRGVSKVVIHARVRYNTTVDGSL